MRTRGILLIALTLGLLPIARGQDPAEINLYFYGAKQKLTRKQVIRLDSLLNTVDPSLIRAITLVGHTDSLFGKPSNLPLAEKRALGVQQLLVERSVPDSLITTVPFHALVPVVEHIKATGRERNRRVFMRIEYGPAETPVRAPLE